ncbi:hypothetical protein ACQP2X_27880 [Actinoplanes sp. CA-131856]
MTEPTISDSRGVQVGTGNHQTNFFGAEGVAVRPEALLEHARELAPEVLEGRDAELAELRDFCFGDEPYVWWEGEPWSGKTALLATFVLNPPDGVDVLHFFIRAGQSYWNDSTAFETILRAQLITHLSATASGVSEPALLHLERAALLTEALDRAQAAGRRLVLVVDGIDEDQSRSRATQLPSIVRLLPAISHPALRVVLAGRHQFNLPADVFDHPALTCPRRRLAPSAQAAVLHRAARLELITLLDSGSLAPDVLGFVVASEGDISMDEIAELVDTEAIRVEEAVVNVGVRTLVVTVRPDGGQAFAFSHESLRQQASDALGEARIARYRGRIGDWSGSYRERRWPAETPFFLLARHGKLLADRGELEPLTELALDAGRRARMRWRLGGDGPALAEIAAGQNLWCQVREPDLDSAARLARARWELTSPNLHMPSKLAAVWALLGRPERASALVDALEPSPQRAEMQQSIVRALLEARRFDAAAFEAYRMEDAGRAWAMLEVALATLAAGFEEKADLLIEMAFQTCEEGPEVVIRYCRKRGFAFALTIGHPEARDGALYQVVEGLAEDGRVAAAEEVAGAIVDENLRAMAHLAIADADGRPLSPDLHRHVLAIAAAAPHVSEDVLASAARCLARAGRHDDAREALSLMRGPVEDCGTVLKIYVDGEAFDAAEELARALGRRGLLVTLCDLLADAGWTGRALDLAGTLTDSGDRVRTLGMIGAKLIVLGDPRGRRIVEDAERMAARAGDESQVRLAIVVGRTADRALIERSLRLVPEGRLASVVSNIALGGHEPATMLGAELLDDPAEQAEVALTLGEIAVREKRPQVARRAALYAANRRLTGTEYDIDEPDFDPDDVDPEDLDGAAELLARAAWILAAASDVTEALRVAEMAETASRATIDPDHEEGDRALLALARAELGDFTEAESLARRLDDDIRAEVLGHTAVLAAENGAGEIAARLAEQVQGDVLQEVTRVLTRGGDLALAARVAGRAASSDARVAALATLARGYLDDGDADHADRLVAGATAMIQPTQDVQLAETAAALAAVAVAAGHVGRVPFIEQRLPHSWQRAVFRAELVSLTVPDGAMSAADGAAQARTAAGLAATITAPWPACTAHSRLITAWAALGDAEMVERSVGAAVAVARAGGEDAAFMLPEPLLLGIDAFLRLGRAERAEQLAGEDPGLSQGCWAHLAQRLAEHGHLDAALRVAESITLPGPRRERWNLLAPAESDYRDDALARVVAVMAETGGRPDEALKVVERITGPTGRSQALTTLAIGCHRNGRPKRARQLMAAALAQGDWLIPVRGLLAVAPEVARGVATAG